MSVVQLACYHCDLAMIMKNSTCGIASKIVNAFERKLKIKKYDRIY